MIKDFLWEGIDKGQRSHLVSFEVVSKRSNLGELGIRNLKLRNNALLAKWS